jgi:[ribosomal protein S18]-alanine N-acetyltransferase
MQDLVIRSAREEDLNDIFLIESEGLSLWKKNQFSDEFETSFSVTLVAESKGVISGFAVIWIITDEIQLHNISVKKGSRRSGIGQALINHISCMKKNLINKITIEVNEKNLPALNFYKKMGFCINGLRKKYYNEDSAILMELVL